MPGTPPTSPRLGLPRFAMTDVDQVPIDLTAVVDAIDPKVGLFASGLLASRPSTGAGIADRYYYATDAIGPNGVTGVLYRDAGGASPTWTAVNPGTRTVLTTLPASPVDGQEILFLADSARRTIWHLRYNAGSSFSSKWEPVSTPAPLYNAVDTAEGTTTTNAYQDLATVGPQVTAPVAGDYMLDYRAVATAGSTTTPLYSPSIGGAAPAAFDDAQDTIAAGAQVATMSRQREKLGIAALATIRMRYMPNAAVIVTYSRRTLAVTPLRVG
jgi:hypothetical protein